jgi:hypothetical protein
MTPDELSLFADAYGEKIEREQEESVTIAYLTAYLHRVERMPFLDELLGKEKQENDMTDDEMLNQVKMLNALFGGTVENGGE